MAHSPGGDSKITRRSKEDVASDILVECGRGIRERSGNDCGKKMRRVVGLSVVVRGIVTARWRSEFRGESSGTLLEDLRTIGRGKNRW